jgi:effector-binding domain-containing protein
MRKKLGGFLMVAIFGFLFWYFFMKPHDYAVSFKTKALPGVVKQSLKIWNIQQDSVQILEEKGKYLVENIYLEETIHQYRWEMEPINDSIYRVTAYIKDLNHSLKNKLTIPFLQTQFEERTARTVIDFKDQLKDHLKNWKVTIEDESELKATYCAYISVETTQLGKARGMMDNYPFLNTFLAKNGVPLNGSPFIEVTSWDKLNGTLSFDFCYPIDKTENLPSHPELKYREFKPRRALKAIYKGNYSTSDRAWYALLNYAQKENINVEELPVEVFLNNPVAGGYELNWTAEVYMPIENQNE